MEFDVTKVDCIHFQANWLAWKHLPHFSLIHQEAEFDISCNLSSMDQEIQIAVELQEH